jgi:hypothetical protein
MADAFDRSGARLGQSFGTIYQAPDEPQGSAALVLSCLAAYVGTGNASAALELRITNAAGGEQARLVQRGFIGPGMTLELAPNRITLLPGERLQGRTTPGGIVDVLTSTLAPEFAFNRRRISSLEVYADFLPPDTVGTDQNVVELPAAVAVNVNFEEPAVLTGFAVQVPPTGADVSFPETVVLIQGIPFGAVTVEPAGLSLELQAEAPFIQAGGAPFFVPAAGIELAAAAPTVATGASVSPAALALGISAVAPEAVGPPTGDPDFASVSLLLPFDGANGSTTFTDASTNALTVSVFGDAQISTVESKFGGSSGLFDGGGDYLEVPSSSLLQFAGDFTIECFVRAGSFANYQTVIELGTYLNGVLIRTASPTNDFVYVNGIGLGSVSSYMQLNTWQHIALTRSGSTVRYFIDGTERLTATISGTVNSSSEAARIGRNRHSNSQDYDGYIDDLRITKGVARYTANFTPPTEPFPTS